MNVTAVAVSPTAIRVAWHPPPAERANGRIAYYKLLCVESGRGDSEATVVKLNQTSFLLDELRRWTEYRIWVLAGTSVGDGPASYPVTVRTHEDGTCLGRTFICNTVSDARSLDDNNVMRNFDENFFSKLLLSVS